MVITLLLLFINVIPIKAASKLQFTFSTDNTIYAPGSEIRFQGVVKDGESPAKWANPTAMLIGTHGEVIQVTQWSEDEIQSDGTFSGRFVLPTDSLNGTYTIQAMAADQKQQIPIKVSEAKVTLSTEKLQYNFNDVISYYGNVTLDGQQAKNQEVTVAVEKDDQKVQADQLTTGEDGKFSGKIKLSQNNGEGNYKIRVTALGTSNNITVKVTAQTPPPVIPPVDPPPVTPPVPPVTPPVTPPVPPVKPPVPPVKPPVPPQQSSVKVDGKKLSIIGTGFDYKKVNNQQQKKTLIELKDTTQKEILSKFTSNTNVIQIPLTDNKDETLQFLLSPSFVTSLTSKNPNAMVNIVALPNAIQIPLRQFAGQPFTINGGYNGKSNNLTQNAKYSISIQSFIPSENVKKTISKFGGKIIDSGVSTVLQLVSPDASKVLSTPKWMGYIHQTVGTNRVLNSTKTALLRVNSDGSVIPVPVYTLNKDVHFYSKSNGKYVIVENNVNLTDIKASKYKNEIQKLSNMGILVSDKGNYNPKNKLTRYNLAMSLSRSLSTNSSLSKLPVFKDIKSTDSLVKNNNFKLAYELGFIKVDSKNQLNLNTTVSKTEAALMLYKFINFVGYDSNKTAKPANFKDLSKLSPDAVRAITTLTKLGFFVSTNSGKFEPNQQLTNEDMAMLVDRALKLVGFIK